MSLGQDHDSPSGQVGVKKKDIIKSKIKRAHEGWLFLCLKITGKLIFKSNI